MMMIGAKRNIYNVLYHSFLHETMFLLLKNLPKFHSILESPLEDEEFPRIKYVAVLIDMKSRFVWTTPLETKESKLIAGNMK
jgi:hypothetical protein